MKSLFFLTQSNFTWLKTMSQNEGNLKEEKPLVVNPEEKSNMEKREETRRMIFGLDKNPSLRDALAREIQGRNQSDITKITQNIDSLLPMSAKSNQEKSPQKKEENNKQPTKFGKVSFYASKFTGRPTASGEKYDPNKLTAAHRTLPFGTLVRVTRGENSVIVKINDRGPFHKSRDLDLSAKAFKRLGSTAEGTMDIKYEVLTPEEVALMSPKETKKNSPAERG